MAVTHGLTVSVYNVEGQGRVSDPGIYILSIYLQATSVLVVLICFPYIRHFFAKSINTVKGQGRI